MALKSHLILLQQFIMFFNLPGQNHLCQCSQHLL